MCVSVWSSCILRIPAIKYYAHVRRLLELVHTSIFLHDGRLDLQEIKISDDSGGDSSLAHYSHSIPCRCQCSCKDSLR